MDWDDLRTRVGHDAFNEVPAKIQAHTDTRNKEGIIIPNAPSFARTIGMNQADLDAMVVHRTTLLGGDAVAVAGSVVRTKAHIMKPGLLVARSWSGEIPPSEDLDTANLGPVATGVQVPVDDNATTPAIRMDTAAGLYDYSSIEVPRRCFHLDTMDLSEDDYRFNTFSIVWSRTKKKDGRMTVNIPVVCYIGNHDQDKIVQVVQDAMANMPVA